MEEAGDTLDSPGQATPLGPLADAAERWVGRITAAGAIPCTFRVRTPDRIISVGKGEPEFEIVIHGRDGLSALLSFAELRIADAYVRGDFDIEGDYIKAMWFRELLADRNLWLKAWRRLQPLLLGRERLNPAWIAKHYDAGNIQLSATDSEYHAYTPGVYENDDESMEASSRRKYQQAFDALNLREGSELLEVGCGWGGMTRFCAERGVRVTAITLSRHQQEFTAGLITRLDLAATVHYQDFFTFKPQKTFDAISCMGVLEDLSDYPRVMGRFAELLTPGGRAYLDFAAGKVPFGTSSFVTKHVWPGSFRMVYMPQLIEAIDRSRIQLVSMYNDRRNYYLWARNGCRRWEENKVRVVEQSGMDTYRLFHLLFMGTAGVMSNPSQRVTAYRMVLELPSIERSTRAAER